MCEISAKGMYARRSCGTHPSTYGNLSRCAR